jgi:hypothetical protein
MAEPVNVDRMLIAERVARPAEALNVEIKNWIDPTSPQGKAKIVRAALALRNRNNGELVIGFNDMTLLPETTGVPADIEQAFHLDKIQEIVTKYASDTFEIAVEFGERDGLKHPVIVIPPGVRVPVAATSDIIVTDKKGEKQRVVRVGAVYFRSLRSNGRVSSTEAQPGDWREIAEIIFNNREADFGAFFRRHPAGVTPDTMKEVFSHFFVEGAIKSGPTPCDRADEWLIEGKARFDAAIAARKKEDPQIDTTFLKFGNSEVSLMINGTPAVVHAGEAFLNLIARSNPNFTGWPVWLDSRGFTEARDRPSYVRGAWETLIISYSPGFSDHVDFIVMEASGRFYLRRVLQDDLTGGRVKPGTALDPWLHLYRVAETIAVGLAFAKAMDYQPAETTLAYRFRWTRLEGRTLAGWANQERMFYSGAVLSGHVTRDDEAGSCIQVPLETPPSALAPFVAVATRELFLAFGGFQMPMPEIEKMTADLLARRG